MDVAGSFSGGTDSGSVFYSENQLRSWLPLETRFIEVEPLCGVSQNMQRVYVESFSINPVAVRVSVHLDSKPIVIKGMRGGLMAVPLVVVNMLKSMAGNIDRAPIALNRLVFSNLLTSRERLLSRLIKHYSMQAAKESYKIVGSFELLGNPVGLISNVSEGLQEFVFAPIRGAKKSPQAFALGLVNGTGALVKGSIYGAFSSVVSLSAAVGKGVAMLSLDDKFERERLESAARHQNDHLGAALAHGFTAVGRGVLSGVTDLFMAPVRGAQEEGFTGLLKVHTAIKILIFEIWNSLHRQGIGKGVLGVVFKPAAGLIELASSTASGVRNMSTLLTAASGCHRIRPSRPFFNGVMQSYRFIPLCPLP
jgi:vacuolar protein sorting-associated protein 13A/C